MNQQQSVGCFDASTGGSGSKPMASEGDSARTQGNTFLITYYENNFETLKNIPIKINIFSDRVKNLDGQWAFDSFSSQKGK